jgi:AcrR family transcriptional regulator
MTEVLGRRERYRRETIEEAKRIALDQLAELGPGGISVNAIAKRMGITGPALYRYFAGRDELLTALVRDAYAEVGTALETAHGRSAGRSPAARFRAVCTALREWTLAQPHRYLLLFGTPVPGYAAPEDTREAAGRALTALATAAAALPGLIRDVPRTTLDRQLAALREDEDLPVAALRRALITWTRLHGVLSL